ncbi:trypsin-like peptidase domain-containing protein [Anabaena azotica]|uniref:Trypsin-like peptidase domain-containing protein n=1 Tax=Anabaena azotica FACHB-119 TaxID=947527 RepID=A0ABR8D8Y3_9NOST|nr:trypsin-like peptidase domain-containing protein [Anabaena azotica]MBD2502596.1 trypsin-like peptidase domain-containing protein [Anabaena azotica FACHB-119]
MLTRHLLSSCLVAVTILTSTAPVFSQQGVQPSTSVQAAETVKELQPDEIVAIARATVVRIEPSVGTPGSGVIIGVEPKEGKYLVLTAKKLVQDKNANYDIVTPITQDGKTTKRQKIRISTQQDIEELADEDLAIITFRSNRKYQTAQLIEVDQSENNCLLADRKLCNGVYVAGFVNPSTEVKNRIFHITQLRKKELNGSQTYSNLPHDEFAGVTGGPVFDASGRVATIYGQTPTQQKASIKRKGFSILRNYGRYRIKLQMTPPLLTISLRDPNPFNFTEEIKETDIETVSATSTPVRRQVK